MNIFVTMMIIHVMIPGLMGAVINRSSCPENCHITNKYDHQYIKHVSNLSKSSAAPWHMGVNNSSGREPQYIHYAVCKNCTVKDMIAEPIYLEISVYQMIQNGSSFSWCRCPYNLAVGCTCVNKQKQ